MPYLAGLASLHTLYLDGTRVTAAGLVHLKSLKVFTILHLSEKSATSEDIAKLKAAIPNLHIRLK
jgi:hypothetical protein